MAATKGKSFQLLQKIAEFVPRLSVIVAGTALCLTAVLVVSEIVSRNLLNYGIPFAVEYSEYALPVIGLVGAAYALNKGDHVRADLILNKIPYGPRQWVILIGYILGLGFLIILTQQSFIMAFINIKMKALALFPTLTPLGYPQLIMGAGFSLFALQLVIEIIRMAWQLFPGNKSAGSIVNA